MDPSGPFFFLRVLARCLPSVLSNFVRYRLGFWVQAALKLSDCLSAFFSDSACTALTRSNHYVVSSGLSCAQAFACLSAAGSTVRMSPSNSAS